MENLPKYKGLGTILLALISAAIFIGNFFVPLGFILWIIFIIPLLIAFYIYDEKYMYPLVTFFSILMIINLFTAPKLIPFSYAIFNRSSGIILFFILAFFMRNQKKSKKKLSEVNLNLEQLISKRTEQLEIANKELAKQNQEKEKRVEELNTANKKLTFQNEEKEKLATELIIANKELNTFAYVLAHDLKAPLRAINGFAMILKKTNESKFDEEGKNNLNIVIENSSKMARMIDDVLEFLKIPGKEIVSTEINMNQIVKEVYDELSLNEKDRIIDFKINPLPATKGDSAMIKQVWVNLIANALKFTSHREKAEIIIGSETKENECIYFIKDNGVGFDTKYIDKLFQVFQRLHSTEEFDGNGIGLAFVKRIIEKHKGRVWAEGKMNEGATFYFSLPI